MGYLTTVAELPIHAVRGALAKALADPRPLVVSAPTGSGKSTCLPAWIAEDLGGPVLVVEPRRVACRALALYLSQRAGEALGDRVGYRVRFEDRTSARTQVCFVTPGVALNLAAAGELGRYAALMLDEFHERSWELDLLVALARRRPGPKLILCSATLAVDALVDALGGHELRSEGRSFPVSIEYTGEDAPSERDLDDRVAAAVEQACASEGDVLVFLPGKGEIGRCAAALERRGCSAQIVAVHGGVSPQRLVDVFAQTQRRRVFLATNVAESSLTLPGVRTVIDSGLVRARVHRGGRSILALSIIARDSMDQRAGRAGRVAPGRCVRLWSQRFAPREVTAPQIERVELDDLILRAASCGLDADELEAAPWVDAPPAFALDTARRRLASVGALDEQGRVSARGRRLARLPVSATRARLLLAAPVELAGAVADLVALLEHGRGLWLPDQAISASVEEARRALCLELAPGQRDEVHGALLGLRRGDAQRHGLQRGALAELRRLADSLRGLAGATPLRHDRDRPLPAPGALAKFVLERVPEFAFVRRPRAERDQQRGRGLRRDPSVPWANAEIELLVREDAAAPGLHSDERDQPPRAGLILDHEWIGVGRRARGRARMVLPCGLAELAAAELGETCRSDTEVEIERGAVRAIAATVERRLAGVVLARGAEVLAGAALREALAELIVEGRRLPPLSSRLAEAILDDLHLWEVVARARREALADRVAPSPDPPELLDWLRARLAELGLEQGEEIELLSNEDLRPRGAALAELAAPLEALGRREWTLAALAEDFPRIIVDRDARYRCRVRFEPPRVTLEPLDARARKRGEPKRELLPRFRGFAVVYRQASRRVVLRE